MKSDVILINSKGQGFDEAVEETKKAAQYRGLTPKETVQLQLITEEMLSMVRSITGEIEASFWLENEGRTFDLYMTTKTVMDKAKRAMLISASTSRKNEAAKSFLGALRDAFEQAMVADSAPAQADVPDEAMNDIYNRYIEDPEWDRYEQSILRQIADNVRISIKGGRVTMIVSKTYEQG